MPPSSLELYSTHIFWFYQGLLDHDDSLYQQNLIVQLSAHNYLAFLCLIRKGNGWDFYIRDCLRIITGDGYKNTPGGIRKNPEGGIEKYLFINKAYCSYLLIFLAPEGGGGGV